MTPEELDRALEEALKVEPPVGYAARVRARVAAEQVSPANGHAWWPLGAVAAAVLVVAGGLALQHDDAPVPVATVTSHAGVIATDGTPKPEPQVSGDRPQATGNGQRATGLADVAEPRGLPRRTGGLPAVLISPDDIAGPRLLVALREAAFATSEIEDGEERAPQIGRIDVMPIEVDLLPQLTPVTIGELQ